MAYKFQLGAARLSGSVTQEGNITAESAQVSASTIALADASGIAGNGLATGSSENGKLEILLEGGATSGLQSEPDGLSIKLSGTANGLQLVSGQGLALQVSSAAELELVNQGIRIADGGIANGKLLNDSVTFGGVEVALGAEDATPAFDLSDATAYPGDTSLVTVGALDAGSITSNFGSINNGDSAITTTGTGSFGKVVISGDLEVQGTTTTIDTTNLTVADKNIVVAQGATDDNDVRGAGLTVDFKDVQWKYDINGIGSANASGDIWIASGSTGLVDIQAANFYGDGSNLNGVVADKATGMTMRSYVTGTVGQKQSLNGVAGFYTCSDANAQGQSSQAVELHLSGGNDGWSNGDIVVIKAYSNAGTASRNITIKPSGSEIIADAGGAGELVLESDMAAVSLIYSDSGDGFWFVF